MHPHNKHERGEIGNRKGFKRARRYWNNFRWMKDRDKAEEFIKESAQHRKNTTKLCSCSICGNERHHYNCPTQQELKDREFVASEFEEMDKAA